MSNWIKFWVDNALDRYLYQLQDVRLAQAFNRKAVIIFFFFLCINNDIKRFAFAASNFNPTQFPL